MNLNFVIEHWKEHQERDLKKSIEAWDVGAENFSRKKVDKENDPFLKLLRDKAGLSKDKTVLDVGCGAGQYDVLIAPEVKKVVAADFSPEMLKHAKNLAEEKNITNIEFRECDWWHADTSDLKGKFDIAFAKTAPAIRDYETFMKLNDATIGYGFVTKTTRRTDSVADELREMAGLKGEVQDDSIGYMFDALWALGYRPELHYYDVENLIRRSLDTAKGWYLSRIEACAEIDEKTHKAIEKRIEDLCIDGVVEETMKTVMATIYWHK